jgi:hypothetical protein
MHNSHSIVRRVGEQSLVCAEKVLMVEVGSASSKARDRLEGTREREK